MKKIVAIILIIVAIATVAYADVNLSSMSFDDLIKLKTELTDEIMSRPEWKEIEISAGSYTIGEDFLEGTFKVVPKNTFMSVSIYDGARLLDTYTLYGENIGKLYLAYGWTLETDSTIILTPYTGI